MALPERVTNHGDRPVRGLHRAVTSSEAGERPPQQWPDAKHVEVVAADEQPLRELHFTAL